MSMNGDAILDKLPQNINISPYKISRFSSHVSSSIVAMLTQSLDNSYAKEGKKWGWVQNIQLIFISYLILSYLENHIPAT